jgi:hypothetical protein
MFPCSLSYSSPSCRIWGSHGGEYEDGGLLGLAPCSLVEVYQRFRGPCCLRHLPPVGSWPHALHSYLSSLILCAVPLGLHSFRHTQQQLTAMCIFSVWDTFFTAPFYICLFGSSFLPLCLYSFVLSVQYVRNENVQICACYLLYVCLSVRLSACNDSRTVKWVFIKFDIEKINIFRHISVLVKIGPQ